MSADSQLSAEQEEHAEQIYQSLREKADQELRRMARLMASKEDGELFGETEFQLRDIVHRIGAAALDTTAELRKKGVPR